MVTVNELAIILHDSVREMVEKGNVLMRRKCTRCEGAGEVPDTDVPMTVHDAPDIQCSRCNGSGFDPFLGWDEIDENTREGRRMQARYLLKVFPQLVG